MSGQKQTAPAEELRRQFMDHSTPLTEAGHWAKDRNEQLEAELRRKETDLHEGEHKVSDFNEPVTEAEWWAKGRIEQLEAENKRLREALEADRPKGIAEKFATLVKKKDGWYRGIIDYKIENGEVTRVGELKVTLVGEQSPNEFFKQEAKGPPLRDPAIEDKWNLTWPSLKTRENRGCRKRLAPGQWWAFCGETDMGQTAPALCTECGGEFKLDPVRQE